MAFIITKMKQEESYQEEEVEIVEESIEEDVEGGQKIEYHIEEIEPPMCPHGPTLVFTSQHEELVKKYKKRKVSKTTQSMTPYYACSASRDQKFCTFRMEQSKWIGLNERQRADENRKHATVTQAEYVYLLDCADNKAFAFCHDCCRILMNPMDANVPKQHRFDLHLTYRCLKVTPNHPKSFFAYPSKLIRAATSNEGQAQYFFGESIPSFLIENVILKFGFRRVLCIGCPSIHEEILAKYPSDQLSSFLLDIDLRFRQFWPVSQFAQFNMFNYFFFNDDTAEDYLRLFLQGNIDSSMASDPSDIIILVDPPFGGRLEFLADTIRRLQLLMTQSDSVEEMPFPALMLFFPYFNEHWVKRSFGDDLKITDHIINYSNHGKFRRRSAAGGATGNQGDGKEAQSPVRVFTNLERSRIDLSVLNDELRSLDGRPFYHWCEICTRYVFKSNNHCVDCGECPARDATKPYGHCNVCGHCVKSTWSHCEVCARCHLAKYCPAVKGDEQPEQ